MIEKDCEAMDELRKEPTSYFAGGCPPCELDDRREGSYPLGLLGALLGAAAGSIPWFLASTFANFFIGWLGFLVGLCACWGYRKFRGARRTGYAMTVIILSSILAVVLSEFASNMYILCTDHGWQRSARHMGISVYRLAAESLVMRENLPYILPNLAMGLLIGGLGIFSARRQVLEYTDPEKAARLAAAGTTAFQQASAATTGMPLPYSFTVRVNKSVRKIGRALLWAAGGLMALFAILGIATDSLAEILPIALFLCLILVAEGLLIQRLNNHCRLEIEGEHLRFTNRRGKTLAFSAGDIASVSVSNSLQRVLYDREGRVLAKINNNMENLILLNQYLSERNVPLRG